MDLCLFQGTFNPIHIAHIKLAEYILNNGYAKKILFIPAYMPPHKNFDESLAEHRFNMVKLAIQANPCFNISDIEFKRTGKSYTYLTICELREKYNISDKIKFIIGTDAFRNIESWYESEKLKDLLHFLVFYRDKSFDKNEFNYLKEKGYEFEFMPLEFKDISSTEIRNQIKNKALEPGLLPEETEEYIIKNGLYAD